MQLNKYQQSVQQFQQQTLSQVDRYGYRLAGLLAEIEARQVGSTYVPNNPEWADLAPNQLPADLLIAIGISVLGLSGLNSEGGSNVRN